GLSRCPPQLVGCRLHSVPVSTSHSLQHRNRFRFEEKRKIPIGVTVRLAHKLVTDHPNPHLSLHSIHQFPSFLRVNSLSIFLKFDRLAYRTTCSHPNPRSMD